MNTSILAWMLGPWEIALILIAALLLFGGKKLPELARGLGKGLRVFKKEVRGVKDTFEEAVSEEEEEAEDDQPAESKEGDKK